MAFTFDPALSSPRDRVRDLIGDTDPDNVEVQNETLDYYLSVNSDAVLPVAYRVALNLAAKYARIVEVTVDHQTTRGQQIADNYRKMAAEFLTEMSRSNSAATLSIPGIFVGGLNSDGSLKDCEAGYDLTPLPMLTSD